MTLIRSPITSPIRSPIYSPTVGKGGGGGAYEAEATALFARFTTPPDDTRKGVINTLIKALKTAGVWSKLDALYLLAAFDAQAARRNWIADIYNLTAVSSPLFTVDRGYTGDNSSSYLRTGFTPSTAGGKYAQNNAHLSAGLLNNVIGNKVSIVSASGSPPFGLLRPRFTGDTFNVGLNTGGGLTTANGTAPTSVGLAAVSRLDGSNVSIFKGSTDFGAAQSTSAIVSAEMQLLGGGGVFSDGQIYAASIGEGLTLAQFMAMDAAINAYKATIGAP